MLNIWTTGNASRRRAQFLVLAATLVAVLLHAQPSPQSPEPFSDRDASTLLRHLSSSLQSHSKKNFLALFDLSKMKDGPLFKQQIDRFFAHADTIRIHLNLADTNADAAPPAFAVDAEMEVQPRVGGQASRVSNRVSFTVARAGSDWKIVDLQPRSFFSLP